MPRVFTATIIFALVASAQAVRAQQYGAHTPIPQTTSAPAMRDLAVQREIHERFRLGLDAEARQDWRGAIPEFSRIIAMQPGEPQHSTASYDLGIAYAGMHRYTDAAAAFRDAIARDNEFLAAYANLIAVDLQRRDLTEARSFGDRFVRLAPQSARALYSRGLVALQSGDLNAAIDDFGKLLLRNPTYAVAHYDLGLAHARLNQWTQAEREFSMAVDLAPAYARARFALATVLLREGRRSEARAALDATLRDAADPVLRNLAAALRNSI
ncbi:MAG: tetratricopeptide repeat protein [Candidatus Eremiobacteraeota bacterium]|nr:tetratricopeptide repeat protein [Candidatus Eremiobacteraeota bacterium]